MLQFPDKLRYNLLCVMGEFVGTFLFLFFSFAGTQVSQTPKPPKGALPNTTNLLYSSLAFGFSLTVNVWAFFRVTGGLFNPAVGTKRVSSAFVLIVLVLVGHLVALSDGWTAPFARSAGLSRATRRGHRVGGRGQCFIPRSAELQYSTRRRRIDLTGSVYRDVSDGAIGLRGDHAGGGQAQVNLSGSGRYRLDILRRGNDR